MDIITKQHGPHLRSRWYDYAEDNHDNDTLEIIQLSAFLMKEVKRALKYGFATMSSERKEPVRPGITLKATTMMTKKPIFTTTTEETPKQKTTTKEEAETKCPVCKEEHEVPRCPKFKLMDIEDRWEAVKGTGICFKCLTGRHRRTFCKAKACGIGECKRSHHSMLHKVVTSEAAPENVAALAEDQSFNEEMVTATTTPNKEEVKLKICPVTVSGPKGEAHILALFDEGSTITLLDDKVAKQIGATGPLKPMSMRGINTS